MLTLRAAWYLSLKYSLYECCSLGELTKVVPEAFATVDGHKRLSLPANHSTINKYGSSRDECFRRVSLQLKAISYNSERIVNQAGNQEWTNPLSRKPFSPLITKAS